MPETRRLKLKEDSTWELAIDYIGGKVSVHLTSKADRRQFPGTNRLDVNEKEWARVARWVDYQRAEDAFTRG